MSKNAILNKAIITNAVGKEGITRYFRETHRKARDVVLFKAN
jgi:hypothetical protein